jgi:hypothetical protein
MSSNPITITFDSIASTKIHLIQESIEEHTSHAKILEGLVDIGFTTALKTLYQQGRIDRQTYKKGLQRLPMHLRSHIGS